MKKQIQLLLAIAFIAAMGEVSNTNAQGWTPKGTEINAEAANDRLGFTLALSSDGNILASGAHFNDGNGSNSGHVRVYDWDGSNWIQKGVDIDGESGSDQSGYSVDLSDNGNILAIGATINGGNGAASGHVRVYEWNGSAWAQKGPDIDGEAAGDNLGRSVSLSSDGNTLASGAPGNDGNGNEAGHVRVYEWNGSTWSQKGTDIDGEADGDQSARSICLSSNGIILAIGGDKNDGNGTFAGHVRVYDWSGTAWTQMGMDIDGEATGDRSGYSVDLSSDGTIMAVGAIDNSDNGNDAGHVRVYEWTGSAWTQMGSDIDGEGGGDNSGSSVSLNSNGNIVAIGAMGNNGIGADAGHVRLYKWNGSSWTQIGWDFEAEAAGDNYGVAVNLNSDGNVLAIGADKNDGNGTDAGHIRVFTDTSTVGVTTIGFESRVSVSPNPSKSLFLIDLGREYKNVKITVKNALGQLVFTKNFSILKSTPLTIKDESGIYFLEITTKENDKARIKIQKL